MTQITLIKNTPRNVTLFAKKKKQNGEGGLPHLLLARETASTYKLAIARDGCVHHVLSIPPCVQMLR